MFDSVDPDFFPAHVYVTATPDAFAGLMAGPPGRRHSLPGRRGAAAPPASGDHRQARRQGARRKPSSSWSRTRGLAALSLSLLAPPVREVAPGGEGGGMVRAQHAEAAPPTPRPRRLDLPPHAASTRGTPGSHGCRGGRGPSTRSMSVTSSSNAAAAPVGLLPPPANGCAPATVCSPTSCGGQLAPLRQAARVRPQIEAASEMFPDQVGGLRLFPPGIEQRDVEGRHRLTRRLTRTGPVNGPPGEAVLADHRRGVGRRPPQPSPSATLSAASCGLHGSGGPGLGWRWAALLRGWVRVFWGADWRAMTLKAVAAARTGRLLGEARGRRAAFPSRQNAPAAWRRLR